MASVVEITDRNWSTDKPICVNIGADRTSTGFEHLNVEAASDPLFLVAENLRGSRNRDVRPQSG